MASKRKSGDGPRWMQKAFGKNPGALHRELGVPEGKPIPAKKMAAARKRAKRTGNTKLMRRLNLAKTGKKLSHKKAGQ